MARPQKTIQQEIDEKCDILIKALWDLCFSFQSDILKSEVKGLIYYAEIIQEKLPKIMTLANTMGRKYVKITDDGQIEEITFDEGYRKIMGYLPKGVNVVDKIRDERELYKKYWYEFVHWLKDQQHGDNSGNTDRQETPNPGRDVESI